MLLVYLIIVENKLQGQTYLLIKYLTNRNLIFLIELLLLKFDINHF